MKDKINNIIVLILSKIPITKHYKLKKINLMLETIGLDKIKELVNNDRYISTRTITNIEDFKLKEKLDNFIDVLEKKFKKEDLHNLYYNKEWVRIIIKKNYLKNLFTGYVLDGQYNSLTNKIYLYGKHYTDSMYHEFFHLASTDGDSINYSSGFSIDIKGYMIGYALNEGYTQTLTERYFAEDEDDVYFFEKKMAESLEIIIGQEKMQSLYLSADFFGLITELKKYYTSEEIEKYLVGMDIVNKYSGKIFKSNDEIIKINELIEDIICFLVKGYCIKKRELYKFTENDKLNLIYFLQNINIKYDKEISNYEFNMNRINQIIEQYLGNFAKLPIDILKDEEMCYNK